MSQEIYLPKTLRSKARIRKKAAIDITMRTKVDVEKTMKKSIETDGSLVTGRPSKKAY